VTSRRKEAKKRKDKKSDSQKVPERTKLTVKPTPPHPKEERKSLILRMKTSKAGSSTFESNHRTLQESEEKYRALFNQARDGIGLIDLQTGQIVDCNPEFENLSGRELKQLKNMKIWELIPPGKVEAAKKKFFEIKEKGTDGSREFELQKPDGEIVPIEYVNRVIRIQGKQYIQSIVRDITELKHTEAKLQNLAHNLDERLKELNCLYGISNFVEKPGISLEEIFQGTVDLIPSAWQYPKITCARVILEGQTFRTKNFRDTIWKQTSDIIVHGHRAGTLEVCYLEQKPEKDEGPFQKDERSLINAIAERLGRITERQRVEESLRMTDNAIASSINPVAIADLEGNLTYVNDSFCKMWGYDDEKEVLGKPAIEFLQMREQTIEIVETLRDKGGWLGELVARRKDGSLLDVQVSASTITDKIGKAVYLMASFIDITQRKQAEEKIKQQKTFLINIIESLTYPFYVIDASDYTIKMANSAVGLANLSENSTCYALTHKSSKPCEGKEHPCPLKDVKKTKKPVIVEHVHYDKEKNSRNVEVHAYPVFDNEGNVVQIIEYLQDITERKRAEEEIQKLNVGLKSQANRLATANKELEAFSYSVSHDLRAPLRTIDGFSRALLEDYADKLGVQGKDYLNRVREATQHMGQLIDDLLKLSHMMTMEMRHQETDLSKLAGSITAQLQKTEPERRVEFVIQKGVVAQGDPRLLRVVLENLLANAWKFTGKHSQAKIEFGITQKEEQTVYFVRDDGAGFDMTYANKLFIPFQRLHSTAEFSGDGIGLVIANRIINRHGGRIWAEGEVEKGATFYFTLK
jgi:PAS domain S-box-containing protein